MLSKITPDRLSSMLPMSGLFKLMRPHQWLKNVFVFAGLLFSENWRNPAVIQSVLLAFAAFCCVSSMVYIVNDWLDRHADAEHPTKRFRPLASGQVTLPQAAVLGAVLLAFGAWLAVDNKVLLTLLALYIALNVAYSLRLKRVPVVDVGVIASGFMIRLLAGTLAVGIAPSRWLLLTGLFVALFLGFSKRKAETFHDLASQRAVLADYPPALLDSFMAVTMTATIITYSLFATSPEAQGVHGERLIYTVPFVIFGLLRYAYQVHCGKGEDVARDLVRDPWILAASVVWLLVFFGFLG
jgi:decaprenyl-phosphate phosphoribosyltransferase